MQPDGTFVLGERDDGRQLWGVALPGHKSRAEDPGRKVGAYVEQLGVWAASQGEAWQLFQAYNGICATSRTPQFQLLEV